MHAARTAAAPPRRAHRAAARRRTPPQAAAFSRRFAAADAGLAARHSVCGAAARPLSALSAIAARTAPQWNHSTAHLRASCAVAFSESISRLPSNRTHSDSTALYSTGSTVAAQRAKKGANSRRFWRLFFFRNSPFTTRARGGAALSCSNSASSLDSLSRKGLTSWNQRPTCFSRPPLFHLKKDPQRLSTRRLRTWTVRLFRPCIAVVLLRIPRAVEGFSGL